MLFSCWISKATDTECGILIAFRLQQLLRERASFMLYKCTACFVILCDSIKQYKGLLFDSASEGTARVAFVVP